MLENIKVGTNRLENIAIPIKFELVTQLGKHAFDGFSELVGRVLLVGMICRLLVYPKLGDAKLRNVNTGNSILQKLGQPNNPSSSVPKNITFGHDGRRES